VFSAFAFHGRHAMRAPEQAACRQPAQLNEPLAWHTAVLGAGGSLIIGQPGHPASRQPPNYHCPRYLVWFRSRDARV